jgi:putative two-component system response regulator
MPYEDAIQIIMDGRGTQFDPLLTDAVVRIKDRFEEIARNNQ